MAADELIAALCAEGRVDSHGEFSLDREKAREKLRTFQVAEPHRYVLHLVALAALRGATRVAFTIDTDDLWCRFDGAPLSAQDFEDLYGSSFSEARDASDRARQQLAVGLHAALALDPRHVRVTSGPPHERVRLVARHGAEDRIEGADGGGAGTEIHVKQRLRPGLAVRFVRHVRGGLPEVRALRERCMYAEIPVALGEEVVSAGLQPRESGLQCVVACSDEAGRRCVAGLRADPHAPAEVRLVRHGVWIATTSPPHLPGGLLAVVADDGLRTDLSATGVIEGAQLDACLALVERAAEAACVAWIEALGGDLHATARERLRPVWGAWSRATDPTTAIGAALAGLPWFTDLFGRPATIGQVREAAERTGAALYTTTSFAGKLSQYAQLVIAAPPPAAGAPSADLVLLRALFGPKLRDATRELECEVRREANRRRWMARPSTAELQPGPYHAVGPLRIGCRQGVVEGVVGLRRRFSASSTIRAIADGHMLCDLEIALPLPIDAAIAGLAPNSEFEAPLLDSRLALGLLALLDAALALIETDMSSWTPMPLSSAQRKLARAYLELRHDPAGPRAWLEKFGFTAKSAAQMVERAPADELPRICKQPQPVPLASVQAPWLAELERFPTASGQTLSLGEVAQALGRGEAVAWTGERMPLLPRLARIVLSLDEDAQALATRVFGAQLTALTAVEVQHLLDEQRFMAQEEEEPGPPHGCVAQVRVERGALRAVLGVMPGETGPARVRVLVRGRFVCERTLWFPLPGVVGTLRDDGLRPSADYVEIVTDAAWKDAVRDLQRAAGRLAAEVVAAAREGAAPWENLWDVLAASFPTATLRRAWDRLARAQGAAVAESSYKLLLGMLGAPDPTLLEDVLTAQLARAPTGGNKSRDPITELAQIADRAETRIDAARGEFVAAILREIRAVCGQARPGASLGEQVASPAPDLLALLPLVRTDDRPGSLAEAHALVESGETIPIVRAMTFVGGSQAERWAFVVSPEREDLLVRLFGEAALRIEVGALSRGAERAEPTGPPRSPSLPQPPHDALAHALVRGADVSGALWLPAEVAEPRCRVGLFDRRGELLKQVSLLPPLPLAGALSGAGVRPDGYVVAMSTAARAAVTAAARELYEELLRGDDEASLRACGLVHLRIGEVAVPRELGEVRQELRERAGLSEGGRGVEARVEAGPPPDDLKDIFEELERESEPAAEASPPPVTRATGEAPVVSGRAPAVPPPPPEVRLLAAIRDELRALRELHDRLLSNFNLEHLRLEAGGGRGDPVVVAAEAIVVDAEHPLVRRAAAEFTADPVWVDMLASLVFTAFNAWRPEITDADELTFHASHLVRVARRLG